MRGADVLVAVLLSGSLLVPLPSVAQPASPPAAAALTREQMRDFLLTAKITRSRDIGKGVTSPKRLTLTDGTLTHDAAFQAVDLRQTVANLTGGGRNAAVEMNFVDAYRYNLGAYAIAEMLGLDHMMPVHVERRWAGKSGSLSWWVDTLMDEGERLKKKIPPPNATDWNQQMYRMRVFAALTRDTDRNLGNVLITPEWKVMMIDFTRAFRLQTELLYAKDLAKIDRALLPRIEALSRDGIKQAARDSLTTSEIEAVLKRRDVIVAHFKKLIADLGENAVLY
ncbi:MAG: hypothetical protein WC815_15925 [Vicinamibacterales bacterium]|jgi:hypothetical protein